MRQTTVFMDRSGNPMTYTHNTHNVRLMMPKPIPPPESSRVLRKGLWDCHLVDGQVVITQKTSQEARSLESGYVDGGSLSRTSRKEVSETKQVSETKRLRRIPIGPRPMKRQETLVSLYADLSVLTMLTA
ncbi:uncharacterized protein LAESUDRAFT_313638 [Laetiporus sulphureus 93-53]|uniref:Uncharacterized protein n=1 Tax=Laetiporus sulphureus 93-53 TaxID=1314785 RepID=A0A165D5U6_9APHY|nr:uncharacterized protein LAESUDRAFT_313638 [Laetiporus sulphureus 93-53]KZT04205.1 hypothetical protein LAESUDRAFT_313638 [Laetiporus sulphureus 93-53]